MTRLELQSFLEIIRSGSITAAADRIHISQPALSRRIRALEEELGYPLFSRGKGVRAVRLTDKGSLFIPVAEKFLRVYQEAAALSRLDQNPVLRLSAVGSLSTYLLPGVFHAFLDQRRYNLSFNNCHSYEAYAFVESGMADLALISDDMYSREGHGARLSGALCVRGEDGAERGGARPSRRAEGGKRDPASLEPGV